MVVCYQNGTEDVKSHKWFKVIDWNLVYQRKLKVSKDLVVVTGKQRKPYTPKICLR